VSTSSPPSTRKENQGTKKKNTYCHTSTEAEEISEKMRDSLEVTHDSVESVASMKQKKTGGEEEEEEKVYEGEIGSTQKRQTRNGDANC
jgi:hypothetical protein